MQIYVMKPQFIDNQIYFLRLFVLGGQTGDKNFGTICKENTNSISFLKIRGNVAS